MAAEQTSEHLLRLREAFLKAFDEDAVRGLALELIARAKRGDPKALDTVLRLILPPAQMAPAAPKAPGQVNVLNLGSRGRKGEKRPLGLEVPLPNLEHRNGEDGES